MRCFDAYSLLDFSARSTPSPVRPSADACWLGTRVGDGPVGVRYFRTRATAMAAWSAWVAEQAGAGRRALCGFDLGLGFPRGLAACVGDEPTWRGVWRALAERVEDDDLNHNNRFAVASWLNERVGGAADGPFWGGAPSMLAGCRKLQGKRRFDWPYVAADGTGLTRLRLCEARAAGCQEVWKLAGVGAVGSQTLLGVAALGRWLGLDGRGSARLAGAAVWPFETGFALPAARPGVLVVEAYPSLLGSAVDRRLGRHGGIRDAAQVDAWCRWAGQADRGGALAGWLGRPGGLSDAEASACVAEEGWVLGVG